MHTVLCFCMYAPLVRLIDHFMLNCAEHNITLLYSDIFSATWRPSCKKTTTGIISFFRWNSSVISKEIINLQKLSASFYRL